MIHLTTEQVSSLDDSLKEVVLPLHDMIGLVDTLIENIPCQNCQKDLAQMRGMLTSIGQIVHHVHEMVEAKQAGISHSTAN